MQQNWLEKLTNELKSDLTSSTAVQFITEPVAKQLAALQTNSAAILEIFKNINPSNENFPLVATMVALMPNSSIADEEYFTWLRFHPTCMVYNVKNLILAVNGFLAAKKPQAQISFVRALIETPKLRDNFNEYLDYQVFEALQFIAKQARDYSNKPLLKVFTGSKKWPALKSLSKPEFYTEKPAAKPSNEQAYKQALNMALDADFNFDELLDCTDVLTPGQLANFFEKRLVDFKSIDQDCNYFLAEIVHQIRAFINTEDLDYLNTKVLIPHIKRDMAGKLACDETQKTGDISIVYALCAEYLERLHQNGLIKPQQKVLAQDIVKFYITTAKDIDYILEGWPIAFAALNFTLNSNLRQQILDVTYQSIENMDTGGIPDGACGILFMYEKPQNLVQCPRYKLLATNDATMRNSVQAIVAKAQSLYTGKEVTKDQNCITDANFMPMFNSTTGLSKKNIRKSENRNLEQDLENSYSQSSIIMLLGLGIIIVMLYKLRSRQRPAARAFSPGGQHERRTFGLGRSKLKV